MGEVGEYTIQVLLQSTSQLNIRLCSQLSRQLGRHVCHQFQLIVHGGLRSFLRAVRQIIIDGGAPSHQPAGRQQESDHESISFLHLVVFVISPKVFFVSPSLADSWSVPCELPVRRHGLRFSKESFSSHKGSVPVCQLVTTKVNVECNTWSPIEVNRQTE